MAEKSKKLPYERRQEAGLNEGEKKLEKETDAVLQRHDQIRKRIARRLKKGKRVLSGWIDEAKEDIAFSRGDQWDPEDKAALEAQGRPALVWNKIKPILDVVSGYERQNSARLIVRPVGAEDKVFSEVFDNVLKHVDRTTHLNFKFDYMFDTGITCGKSHLEITRIFDKDPIWGSFKFIDVSPFNYVVDPTSREYNYDEDSDWGIKLGRYTKSKLKAMYPKAQKRIDAIQADDDDYEKNADDASLDELQDSIIESDRDNYDNLGLSPKGTMTSFDTVTRPDDEDDDTQDDMLLTVKEEWCKKMVEKWVVYYVEDGITESYDTEDLAKAASKEEYDQRLLDTKNAAKFTDDGQPLPNEEIQRINFDAITAEENIIQKRQVPEMWVYTMIGGHIVQEAKSPLEPWYSGFTIKRFIADWSPHAETEEDRVHGIVRQIKDPQREVNKSNSSMLHIIATGANSGWIGDKDALTAEEWKELEKFGSKPGGVWRVKVNRQLRRIEPSGMPYAQLTREQGASDKIKEISGINADLLGLKEGESKSGRAMAIRVKQAVMILEKSFKNFRYTKEMVGEAIFRVIPAIYTASRIKRILGEQFMQDNELTLGKLKAYLQLVKDGEYEVAVTDAENSATLRQETFESLMELAGQGYPVPPEVIMRFSSIPNSAEVAREIQAYQEKLAAQGQPIKK